MIFSASSKSVVHGPQNRIIVDKEEIRNKWMNNLDTYDHISVKINKTY